MADAKNQAPDAKTMDVAKPSKAPASSPTPIMTHKMVTEPGAEDSGATQEPAADKTSAPSTKGIRLEPISRPEDLKSEETKKQEAEATTDTSDHDDAGNDLTSRDKLKEASTDEQDLMAKKAAERQANFDKIALAKTYYLPINQVVRRRSKHVAIIGAVLIILLGLAWVDVSLDAGLISIPGVKAPTHFFSK